VDKKVNAMNIERWSSFSDGMESPRKSLVLNRMTTCGRRRKSARTTRILYQKGVSNETHLLSGCADIVTVATAFHWMDIENTLAEVHKILKDGGVFAVVVGGYPSVIDWKVEQAYRVLAEKCAAVSCSREKAATHNARNGISYLEQIQASGKFQYAKETACHSVEPCTVHGLAALTLTQGNVNDALKIDPSLQKDVDAFDVVFAWKMWMAVK